MVRETKFCCFSLYVFVCSAATHMLHTFNFAHDAVKVVIVKRSGFAC